MDLCRNENFARLNSIKNTMQFISVSELKSRLDAGEKLNLIDVREPDEHKEFNIGGTLVPLGQILTMMTEEIDDLKDQEVICYCRSGKRSMQASLMLETIGFTQVLNLQGGMNAWQEQQG